MNQLESMIQEGNIELEMNPDVAEESGGDRPLTLADFTSTDFGEIISCPMGYRPENYVVNEDGKGGKAYFNIGVCRACSKNSNCPVKVRVNQAKLTYSHSHVRITKRREFENSKEFREKYRWRSGID
jgi:hypothetical protein